MFLDKLSQSITSFRQNIILGIFLFLIVISSFFSGEWNNWLTSIFLVVLFPLAFYTILLLRDKNRQNGYSLRLRSPFLCLIIFLLAGLITAFFSVMKYNSFHYWTLLVAYAIIFWVAVKAFSDFSKVRFVSLVIFATGVLASLINLFLFIKDPTVRAGGALLNANALGSYFLFSLPLGITLTIDAQRQKLKYIFGAGIILILISFFLTFSYTGWVSFLIPLLIILLVYKKQLFTRRNVLIFAGAIIVLLVVAIGIRYSSTRDFKQAIALQKTIPGSGISFSFNQRWDFISSATHIFTDRIVGGTGLATYQQVYPRYALTVLEQPRYVHNYYLQTAAEVGIIGLISLLGFVVMLLVVAYRVIKNNFFDTTKRPYFLGLGLGIVGSAIHSLFDFGWQFPAVFLLFWISGGLLLGQQSPLPLRGGASGKSVLAIFGSVCVVLISLVLLTRGITLFLSQSYFDRAEPKKMEGNLEEALPLYKVATRLDPAPDKMRSYATALFEWGAQKKDDRAVYYQQADDIFRKTESWNPGDYFAYHEAGRMYFMRQEYDAALAQYRQALHYDPVFHPDFQYDLAFLFYTQKKYDEVRTTIQPVLDRYASIVRSSNPNLLTQLAFLNLLLGKSYADQGNKEQARHYFQEALARQPDFSLGQSELEQLK